MGGYLCLVGSLGHNLVRRVAEDLADCAALCKRGLLYKLRSIRMRYDDVGPVGSQDWSTTTEHLAILGMSIVQCSNSTAATVGSGEGNRQKCTM